MFGEFICTIGEMCSRLIEKQTPDNAVDIKCKFFETDAL
jgi:hypothetical protein